MQEFLEGCLLASLRMNLRWSFDGLANGDVRRSSEWSTEVREYGMKMGEEEFRCKRTEATVFA